MEIVKINVVLASLSDIMFDKFERQEEDTRPPEQKLYLDDKQRVVLPASNILDGFLFGKDPAGCARTFEGKGWDKYVKVGLGHVYINQAAIPFLRNGKEVIFQGAIKDPLGVVTASPRVKKGTGSIKCNAKTRPILMHPWELQFQLILTVHSENTIIDEVKLNNWFEKGGVLIGLGTWRPRFGRFQVQGWELVG
jgi:hypothetical protein